MLLGGKFEKIGFIPKFFRSSGMAVPRNELSSDQSEH